MNISPTGRHRPLFVPLMNLPQMQAQMHMYTGKQPTMFIHDDIIDSRRYTVAELSITGEDMKHLVEALKRVGITPPKHATESLRDFERFTKYALKRGRSKHPHNVKWKPFAEMYQAMQVAAKLGR